MVDGFRRRSYTPFLECVRDAAAERGRRRVLRECDLLQHQCYQRPMPRPYLPTLRAYLFAPCTRAWIDAMVWSSAQPHGIDDVILHTFGNDRAGLVTVPVKAWDTLGLAE